MKRIIILFFFILFSLLLAGKFLDFQYRKYWRTTFNQMDAVFKDSINYDGIYLGDSRVHLGVNPFYIDSITGLQTFNLGLNGAPITETSFLAKAYLSRHKAPRFALISISHYGLLESKPYFQNPCYYFFFLDNELNNQVLSEQKYHTGLFKVLPILKYTAFDNFNKTTIIQSIAGNTLPESSGVNYRGFSNNLTAFARDEQHIVLLENDSTFQKELLQIEALVQLLKKNNCLPIFVYPPHLGDYNTVEKALYEKTIIAIAKISSTYSAPVLHYDTDTSFKQNFFADEHSHLNITGTKMYSEKLGFAIKQLLSSPH